MQGRNQWEYNEEIKVDATRYIEFTSLPELLLIDVLRWNGYSTKSIDYMSFDKVRRGWHDPTTRQQLLISVILASRF
jgi:hypothetical protein